MRYGFWLPVFGGWLRNTHGSILRTAAINQLTRLFALAILSSLANAQHAKGNHVIAEYREDGTGFEPTISLGPSILKALVQQPQITYLRDTKPPHPEDFFKATRIRLNPTDKTEVDLLVMGVRPPVTGVDNNWFWIVKHAESHPQVILYANGLSVALFASVHNGLRDVECHWNSPNEYINNSYRYDGRQYRLVTTREGPFTPKP